MKNKITTKNIYAILLTFASTSIIGYEFDFNNWTEVPLLVMLEKEGGPSTNRDFQIIKPGEMVKHVWQGTEGAYCIRNTMKWAQWRESEAEYKKWASDRGRIPSEKQGAFEKKYLTEYAWNNLPIKIIPDALFKEISKNATQLVKGIVVIGKGLGKLVKASSKLAGRSLCKSRVFEIIDTDEKDPKTRKPLLEALTSEGG